MSRLDKPVGAKRSSDPYQTEAQFKANLARQIAITRQVLAQHSEYKGRDLRLQFFFYTNTSANAEALNAKLVESGYESQSGPTAADPALFMTTGWTTPIRTEEAAVISWIESMCRLGFAHDAEFESNRGPHRLAEKH